MESRRRKPNMLKCLFCPDCKVPYYSKWLTKIIDWHHVQKRRISDYVIPVCRYHHSLIEQNKIDKNLIVQKANKFFGEDLFFLPYPESKHIKTKERS